MSEAEDGVSRLVHRRRGGKGVDAGALSLIYNERNVNHHSKSTASFSQLETGEKV